MNFPTPLTLILISFREEVWDGFVLLDLFLGCFSKIEGGDFPPSQGASKVLLRFLNRLFVVLEGHCFLLVSKIGFLLTRLSVFKEC